MNPVRLFAMQSTRVPPSDMQPRATGAPGIDSVTAAAICAGMPERWYKAAMFKWGLDLTLRRWLFVELWMETMELAQKGGWKNAKVVNRCGNPLTARALSGMPAGELSDFEEMLERTDGVGASYIVADIAISEIGSPRMWNQPEHWTKKAVAAGVGKSAWFDTWDGRVAESRQCLEDWAGRGYAYAARRQAGNSEQLKRARA